MVDADCRVHGTANLFVAGSSVFPTAGNANPTLTIVALALRLADHLKQSALAAGQSPSVASPVESQPDQMVAPHIEDFERQRLNCLRAALKLDDAALVDALLRRQDDPQAGHRLRHAAR